MLNAGGRDVQGGFGSGLERSRFLMFGAVGVFHTAMKKTQDSSLPVFCFT
jgi:hypothetical protein